MTRITRVEVITNNGREYIHWEDDNDISYMLQDSNRTLKVFVGKAPPEQPMTEEENERYFEEAKQIVENHFAKKKMTEAEQLKAEIKVLEKKLSFLEELEQTKSPAEEAYRRWWGEYPSDDNGWEIDNTRWRGFRVGYNYAQKDYKVGEYQEPAKDKVPLYKRFYKKGWITSADYLCKIVRGFLLDEGVIECEDEEYITFTLQKSLLNVPND
jgi:hypothetical protein